MRKLQHFPHSKHTSQQSSGLLSLPRSVDWTGVALAAGAAGLGLLTATLLFPSSSKTRSSAARHRRRLLYDIHHKFASKKSSIISRIAKEPWCRFTKAEVGRIYDSFDRLMHESTAAAEDDERLVRERASEGDFYAGVAQITEGTNPEDGRLSRHEFCSLYWQLGIREEQVIESLYRTWDENSDGSVDFYELVMGLDITANGTDEEKLERFFQAYDLDRNGTISIDELRLLVRALLRVQHRTTSSRSTSVNNEAAAAVAATTSSGKRQRHKSQSETEREALDARVDEVAGWFMRTLDSSQDLQISHSEFMKMKELPFIDLSLSNNLSTAFLELFGL